MVAHLPRDCELQRDRIISVGTGVMGLYCRGPAMRKRRLILFGPRVSKRASGGEKGRVSHMSGASYAIATATSETRYRPPEDPCRRRTSNQPVDPLSTPSSPERCTYYILSIICPPVENSVPYAGHIKS